LGLEHQQWLHAPFPGNAAGQQKRQDLHVHRQHFTNRLARDIDGESGAHVRGLRHTYATELASSDVSVYTLTETVLFAHNGQKG
jgi:integrase